MAQADSVHNTPPINTSADSAVERYRRTDNSPSNSSGP